MKPGKVVVWLRLLFSHLVCLVSLFGVFLEVSYSSEVEDPLPAAFFLEKTVELNFVPTDAYYFVEFENHKMQRVQANLVPPGGQESMRESAGNWLVGTKVAPPEGAKKVSFSIIVIGEKGELFLVSPLDWNKSNHDFFEGDSRRLREHLLSRRKVLDKLNVELATQEASLKRLRADAEVIADIGKIVELRDRRSEVELEIKALDRDIDSLKASLELVKRLPEPQNFSQRELELTQQISELASLARTAENTQSDRNNSSEDTLARQIRMIEMTRYDDPQMLERELAHLEGRLKELESEANKPSTDHF